LVLDPFCGGGTTCVAATHLNRRYLAFEIAPETMEVANARLLQMQEKICT
jgi:site-specific DNA-methyltransferase (adenine-specific)